MLMSATDSPFRWVRLRNGRSVAYEESGDPAGMPVFVFHGLPGSRCQQHPDARPAFERRLRLIHPDRPGFGRSDPAPGRTLASWADDVGEMAEQLGFHSFAVLGVSGGGPFALACAVRLGARVRKTAVVSTVGPPGSMAGDRMTLVPRIALATARLCAPALRLALNALTGLARRNPDVILDAFARGLADADGRILSRWQVRAMLAHDLLESLRQGPGALWEDLRLETRDWGIDLTGIASPVLLWHGTEDRVIPPSATRAIARAVRHAESRYFEREGHFLVYSRWEPLLDWLRA